MSLIRHHPDSAEREAADRERASRRCLERNREEAKEKRHRKEPDVTVGLDETPPEEIVGIDVMHAERHEKAVSDHGQIASSPRVGDPVNEPGAKLGGRHAAGKRHRNPPLPQINPRRDAERERAEHQKRRGDRGSREDCARVR